MEIWGRCPECERWFYCDEWTLSEIPRCPVCGVEASSLVNLTSTDVVVDEPVRPRCPEC